MNFDELQQTWQSQEGGALPRVNADLLLKEMQRSHGNFRSTIFWRDFREVAVALVMLPMWIYMGSTMALPWTWYLTVPPLIWVAGFILVDRKRHPQRVIQPGEPLVSNVKASLAQVEHQIWLLRNVFWWYLLPFSIPILAFFFHVAWRTSGTWWGFVIFAGLLGLFLLVLYGWVFRLNQRAVREQLEPRRRNLSKLVASLEIDTTDENSDDNIDFASALADPVWNCGLSSNWAENWNLIVPSWRVAAMIILPTLGGALCGLYSGLQFQIHDMGPTLFQAVVGAVVPFEIALGLVWWRSSKKKRQSALTDHEPSERNSRAALASSSDKVPTLLPRAPALMIIGLTLFLGIMAFVGLNRFVSEMAVDPPSRRELAKGEGDPAVPESYVGEYEITPQFVMTVTVEGGKLFVQATGQGKLPLERESSTKFSCKLVSAEISFVRDDDGKFSQLVLHQGGANQVATRR